MDKIDDRRRFMAKKETRMERIERMLDEILASKHLSVFDKRDQYIIILQELFDERERLNQDSTLQIRSTSPNMSQQSMFHTQSAHQLSQTSPLSASHMGGVRHNVSGVSGATPNLSSFITPHQSTASQSIATPNLPSPFSGPPFVGMLPFTSTPQPDSPYTHIIKEELKKILSDKSKVDGINLLNYLQSKKHGKSINWNERGEVFIEGSRIPNSSIVNLIAHAVSNRNKKLKPAEGFEKFATYLINNAGRRYYGSRVRDFKDKKAIEGSTHFKPPTDTPQSSSVAVPKRNLLRKTKEEKKPYSKGQEIDWIPF